MDQPRSRKAVDATASRVVPPVAVASPRTVLVLDAEGPEGSGRRYAGSFRYKVPSLGDRIDIDVRRAHYVQQMRSGLGEEMELCAQMLAYLSVTIESEGAPAWWTEGKQGLELYDFAPVARLYALAVAYESSFFGFTADDRGGEGAAEDRAAPADPDDVVGDVQPAPKRREVIADLGAGGVRAGDDAARVSGDGDGALDNDADPF